MKKLLTATAALSVLLTAAAANAQPGPPHRNDRYESHAQHRYHAGRYQPPHGYKARHWVHGDRLPAAYRTKTYVVDYHRYGLRAPPRGYQYVRVGDDVVLAAIATGVISSVITQLFQ